MEGTPILAMKKSMTPRKGPTRITANAIHLLAGSLLGRALRALAENAAFLGAILFGERVAIPEPLAVADVAIENFIPDEQLSKLSDKKNSLSC